MVNKAAQTISFASLPDKTLGDASFALAATASSGLPVSFSLVSGPATLSGNTITLTGVGTVVIRAGQSGNANYSAATAVERSFRVLAMPKQAQTITFTAIPNKTFGTAPFSVNATASSGLPVSFSILSGPATITGNTVTITGAGTVVVEASQTGNDTYSAAPAVTRTFTVDKASQTISFAAIANKTYGDEPFSINASASSGLPVTLSIVLGPATIAGNVITITGAGAVMVRAAQSGNENYLAATSVDRSFTVSRAQQTITVPVWADMTAGGPAQTITATASSGLPVTISVVSGPIRLNGNQLIAIGPGGGCISFSQGGNNNFLPATSVQRCLQINAADEEKESQTITIAELSDKTFGDAPFTLSATASSGLPVSFSIVSGPATIAGNTVTITGAGTIVVRASQAGNDTYNAATPVNRSFIVNKAAQSITFAELPDKTIGNAPFMLSATASSGLPVSFAVVSGPATISGNMVTLTGTGTVEISATQAGNTNYLAATPVQQSFAVMGTTAGCTASGFITHEQYNAANPSGVPVISTLTAFEANNKGDFFAARILGYICPPQTGNYTFWISGDDATRLTLSTDANPANAQLIAYSTSRTNFREYKKYASQKSAPIYLEAGKKYYIEAQHAEFWAGDHVTVAWQLPNGTFEGPIPGSRLSPYVSDGQDAALAASTQALKMQVREMNTAESTATPKGLTVYPNPFSDKTKIEFVTQEEGELQLEVFDTKGELVQTLYKGKAKAGILQQYELDGRGLAAGVYVCRVTYQGKTEHKRIMLLK